MRIFLILVMLLVSSPVLAADMAKAKRIEAAWLDWAKKNRVRKGAIVVSYRGKPVLKSGIGVSTDHAFEIASLSKSVTGACVAVLMRERKIALDDTVGTLIDPKWALGKGTEKITVAQLLTHSSGLRPDSTQKDMWKTLGARSSRHGIVAKRVLKRAPKQRGSFFYNNDNYAVLGVMIERVTGQDFVSACKRRVGLKGAKLSKRVGSNVSWGGWVMSMPDFAAFHARNFGPGSAIAKTPGRYALLNLGGGRYYSMGMFHRRSNGRSTFWHFGKYCFSNIGMKTGAYAVSWLEGWSASAAYEICATDRQMSALDTALVKVVFK